MTAALFLVLGLCALTGGAELLVRGGSRLALTLGISPLVVGLTVVAFGTSAPETAVSVGSALRGSPDVAVGNVVGSNVFNVLCVLGLSALVSPLVVGAQVVRQEVPVMLAASVLLVALSADAVLSRTESALLLALLGGYTAFLVRQSRRESAAVRAEFAGAAPAAGSVVGAVVLLLAGLALLVLGAEWLVRSATTIARALGVSEMVIGLTVVAAGTSLPEAATSIMAAFRGERDIAVGNVIGSNTFNVLGCLGASGLVARGGLPVRGGATSPELLVMLAVAALCVPVVLTGRQVSRREGALFVLYYAAYATWLGWSEARGAHPPAWGIASLLLAPPALVVLVSAASRPAAGRR